MEDARETPRFFAALMTCLIGNESQVNTSVLKGSEAQKRQLHHSGFGFKLAKNNSRWTRLEI